MLMQLYEATPDERRKLKDLYLEADKNGTRLPGQSLQFNKNLNILLVILVQKLYEDRPREGSTELPLSDDLIILITITYYTRFSYREKLLSI